MNKRYYAGIDLHSDNSVLVVIDDADRVHYRKRLRNELARVIDALKPFEGGLVGAVVESTYNWYWLVDGLMDAGHCVHLANTMAIQQYSGLKHGDDESDAQWLAHLLRLGILPEGHIYPKATRPVRDLLRKRSQLVRMQTSNVLAAQNIIGRNSGIQVSGNAIKRQSDEDIDGMGFAQDVGLAIKSNLAIMSCLKEQIGIIEKRVLTVARSWKSFERLLTVNGIGKILGLTIVLETGAIERFAAVGDYSSYARCVQSQRMSNAKRKGQGNRKNGNKYLSWAFIEAANFAIRYEPRIKKWYQRKASKTMRPVALKAVAHKLARASYYILRDDVDFDVEKAFG